jgi:hypothetical protein
MPSPSTSPIPATPWPNSSKSSRTPVRPPVVSLIFCSARTVPSGLRNRMWTAPRSVPPSSSQRAPTARSGCRRRRGRRGRSATSRTGLSSRVATSPPVVSLIFWWALTVPSAFEEQDVDWRRGWAAVVVVPGADGDVGDAVAVEVADGGDAVAELVEVVEVAGEAAGGVADLLLGADGAVGVHEQDVDGAAVGAAVVVFRHADGEVVDAVAVEVADRPVTSWPRLSSSSSGPVRPPAVAEIFCSSATVSDGRAGFDVEVVGLAVAVGVEGVAGVAVAVGVGVLEGGGDAVAVVVGVEVVGDAVAVGVGSGVGGRVVVAVAVPVLLAVPQAVAVGVCEAAEVEDVDGAAVGAAVVVAAGADGEADGAVAVEVAEAGAIAGRTVASSRGPVRPPWVELIFCSARTVPSGFRNRMWTAPRSVPPSSSRWAPTAMSGVPSPSRSPRAGDRWCRTVVVVEGPVRPPSVELIFCSARTVPSGFRNRMWTAPRLVPPSSSPARRRRGRGCRRRRGRRGR